MSTWNLSNENLLELIDNLRLAGRGGYFLDNDDWCMLCDDAANAIEKLSEQVKTLNELALDEMAATNQKLGLYDE